MTSVQTCGTAKSLSDASKRHNQEKQKFDGIIVKSAVPKYRWVVCNRQLSGFTLMELIFWVNFVNVIPIIHLILMISQFGWHINFCFKLDLSWCNPQFTHCTFLYYCFNFVVKIHFKTIFLAVFNLPFKLNLILW